MSTLGSWAGWGWGRIAPTLPPFHAPVLYQPVVPPWLGHQDPFYFPACAKSSRFQVLQQEPPHFLSVAMFMFIFYLLLFKIFLLEYIF